MSSASPESQWQWDASREEYYYWSSLRNAWIYQTGHVIPAHQLNASASPRGNQYVFQL
jgi:hypothetical protein